jgi:hypothetical protein
VQDFLQLELHLLETRPGVKPEAFLTELIQRWLARETERLGLRNNGPALRGFQWKSLFLPDGTILRTSHDDSVDFAKVSGDRIIADDGTVLTPSLFANRHTSWRNAWRFVWLRFPGENGWVRADNCRECLNGQPRKRSTARAETSKTVQNYSTARSIPVDSCDGNGDFGLNSQTSRRFETVVDRSGAF